METDDDVLFDRIDDQLSFLIPFISSDMILGLCLYGITISSFSLWGILLFLTNTVFTLIMTTQAIKLTKIMYPEKKGHPLDFNFDKEWVNSCDEGEKYVIYKASYKCYQIMNYIYSGAITVCLLLSLAVYIGIFPFTLIAFLWISQTVIYSIYATKYQRGQLDNVK